MCTKYYLKGHIRDMQKLSQVPVRKPQPSGWEAKKVSPRKHFKNVNHLANIKINQNWQNVNG